jgi:hypothetical protein
MKDILDEKLLFIQLVDKKVTVAAVYVGEYVFGRLRCCNMFSPMVVWAEKSYYHELLTQCIGKILKVSKSSLY